MSTNKKPFLPVHRRTLLFIAGCVYILGGGILIARAITTLLDIHLHLLIEISIGIIGGICFFFILFRRVSKKHILRITSIEEEYPGFFSFFGLKSYLLMAIMITAGITVRMTGLVNIEYLYTFYISMGLPLVISAVRFFIHWNKNKNL